MPRSRHPAAHLAAPIAVVLSAFPLSPPASAQAQREVWYSPPVAVPSPRFSWPAPADPARIDAHLLSMRRAYEAAFAERARDPFAARVRAAGGRVVYGSPFAPAVIVEGPAAALERIRALPEVVRMDAVTTFAPETDVSRLTVRADAIERLPLPVTGKGVKQCVLEAESAQSANPWLANVTYFQSPNNVPYGHHPTAVSGIIASTHSQYRGQAPGVTLLNANAGSFSSPAVLQATDWAVRQGAHNINASFGSNTGGAQGVLDHYFDHLVRHLLVNFIKGAGNTGGYVVSPGLGFNSVTVGNSFDNKTPEWADDLMNPNSGYLDPTTGHPKPEIVAPGTSLNGLLHVAPWVGRIGSGGSFAGPQGNAVAALLLEREPALKLWPEAVKAVLLATAWHKIDRTALIGDRDGTGQLNALAADAVVRGGADRLRYGILQAGSFDSNGNHDLQLRLDPGHDTRAVLSFSSDPATQSPHTPNTLLMDLDLVVLDPSNRQVAASSDARRGFEIVRFTPQVSGLYTFRLQRKRFQGTAEPFGLAVSQAYDTWASWIEGPARLPLGTTSTFTMNDPYHASHGYVAAASLSGGSLRAGVPFAGFSVPLVPDFVTVLSLTPGGGGVFGGYSGTLDNRGQASLTVTLPPLPGLLGLELTQVALTLDRAGNAPVQITPPVSGRIVR